jgi:hypothetical protein
MLVRCQGPAPEDVLRVYGQSTRRSANHPVSDRPPYPKTWRSPGMGRRDPIAPFVHQMAKKHDSRGEDKRRGSVPDVSLETYLPLACYS